MCRRRYCGKDSADRGDIPGGHKTPGWKNTRSSPSDRVSEPFPDRKSTRLNSSHSQISYAVFCLKNKQHVQVERNALAQHTLLRTHWALLHRVPVVACLGVLDPHSCSCYITLVLHSRTRIVTLDT